jgi:DNA-directed RNA polymerase subunit RPC12/RpoP
MPAVTGKRYKCTTCGAEFIVTKGADDAELRCGESPLEQL